MRAVTDAHPIGAAMNTHGNGDHCFGNGLLPAGAEIYATVAAAEEMQEAPPQLVNALKHADAFGPEVTAYLRRIFGPFEFEGVELRPPTATFEGGLDLRIGDRAIRLIEVGPAHTAGDAIVHVPTRASCSPATSSSSAARPSSGPARSRTGWPPATASSRSTRTRSSPVTGR